MSTTESSPMHIEVSFKEYGADITRRYAVTADILRQAQIWSAQQKPPATEAQTASWFHVNGANLDSKDGPADVVTYADGLRTEQYFDDGKLDRADGPAYVRTDAKGTRIEEYYRDGKRDRADGPAAITICKDARIEEYWHGGKRDRADGPAIIVTHTDGTRTEQYFHGNKQDRADGPAYVETCADGTRIEQYWHDDKLIKEERLAPLSALRGVKIINAPPAPAP